MADQTTSVSLKIDTSGLTSELKDAATAIERDFATPAAQSANILSQAFDRTFSAMQSSLDKAARTGQLSVKSMVDAMIADLSRLAFDKLVAQPITGFLQNAIGGLLNFGGGRATGGPVSGAQAYVVGEHGPELFVPAGAGQINPLGSARAGAATINFNITTPDAESFRRSETQVTAMLARAVARGQRGL
jgi:phage-related minor tail protein